MLVRCPLGMKKTQPFATGLPAWSRRTPVIFRPRFSRTVRSIFSGYGLSNSSTTIVVS